MGIAIKAPAAINAAKRAVNDIFNRVFPGFFLFELLTAAVMSIFP